MSERSSDAWSGELPQAWGGVVASGVIRSVAEDFQVDEELGFEPDGEGQHLLLQIRKRDTNTDWLARELARFAGVSPNAVSYAGMKDRHAVTTQWFSIDLAGRPAPAWDAFGDERIEFLQIAPHRRKLRRGALRGNRFRLRVRELVGDPVALGERVQRIAAEGVPNWFAEQRFGRGGGNLSMAERLFAGELNRLSRHKRGIYLSAARSRLFNQILAGRLQRGIWNRPIPGDLMMLDGRHALFAADQDDPQLVPRTEALEIHPTGPLWGRGGTRPEAEAVELERELLGGYEAWCQGLERFGLEADRRALRMRVGGLRAEWLTPADLVLEFSLTAGSYATAVLRELIDYREPRLAVAAEEGAE